MLGTLYIVATPIGNMQDITLRAISVLSKVNYIACEDTRKTAFLLKEVNGMQSTERSSRPFLISYYEQNESQRIPKIINILENGFDAALVSDAGTPAISDPGFKLIRECIRGGIKVISVPGPTSLISALVTSGLPTDKFLFLGYPPRKPGHRIKFFQKITPALDSVGVTVILFESPHRILQTLEELNKVFGDIDIVICRELTKVHEEVRREKISSSIAHFSKINPKGEFVILFNLANQNE